MNVAHAEGVCCGGAMAAAEHNGEPMCSCCREVLLRQTVSVGVYLSIVCLIGSMWPIEICRQVEG